MVDSPTQRRPGLYLVELLNDELISVNAHDPRKPDCIKVRRGNCKVGKAKNLAGRKRLYERVFGAHNVVFRVLAHVDDIARCERLALRNLDAWRVRGPTGRKNEWLAGITADEVIAHVLAAVERHRESGR